MIRQTKSFSMRLLSGAMNIDPKDIHSVANQMLFEINMLAGQMLILQHKLIEVIKVAPMFVSEFLKLEFEVKNRERLTEGIFRQVIPTSNFALLPKEEDQDIGETHKSLARIKRKAQYEQTSQLEESKTASK